MSQREHILIGSSLKCHAHMPPWLTKVAHTLTPSPRSVFGSRWTLCTIITQRVLKAKNVSAGFCSLLGSTVSSGSCPSLWCWFVFTAVAPPNLYSLSTKAVPTWEPREQFKSMIPLNFIWLLFKRLQVKWANIIARKLIIKRESEKWSLGMDFFSTLFTILMLEQDLGLGNKLWNRAPRPVRVTNFKPQQRFKMCKVLQWLSETLLHQPHQK